jgi:crotonobetaine/carnitine-CoA ligase
MIPHGMFVAPMATYARAGYLRPGDRVLTPSPMFHMGCQSAMLMAPLAVGASVCFLKRFSASEFMRTAREIEATVLYGVGAAAIAILRRPPDPLDAANTLRCAIWTPLAPPQADEFERRFDVWTSSEAYGQTEFLPITLGDVEKSPVRGSAGMPVEIAEVKVFDEDGRSVGSVEVGEICVRPRRPDVMSKGYWKSPEASLRSISNLWHHTGDLGRLDEDGRLWIVDRKVDALRRRGENISSTEIEAAIVRHPSVEEAAVVGVASEMSEQDVKAYLRLAPSTRISPVELFEFFREELPYFSIPRYVDLVEEFPVNALGRIQKDRLRQLGNTSETWDFDAMGYSVDPGDRR